MSLRIIGLFVIKWCWYGNDLSKTKHFQRKICFLNILILNVSVESDQHSVHYISPQHIRFFYLFTNFYYYVRSKLYVVFCVENNMIIAKIIAHFTKENHHWKAVNLFFIRFYSFSVFLCNIFARARFGFYSTNEIFLNGKINERNIRLTQLYVCIQNDCMCSYYRNWSHRRKQIN